MDVYWDDMNVLAAGKTLQKQVQAKRQRGILPHSTYHERQKG